MVELLVTGYWLLVAGCWLLVAGCCGATDNEQLPAASNQ
jgi:hypothetical protein